MSPGRRKRARPPRGMHSGPCRDRHSPVLPVNDLERPALEAPPRRLCQDLQRNRIVQLPAQIDPGVLREETKGWIGPGKQHGYHRKCIIMSLTLQGKVLFPLLPRTHAMRSEHHRDGIASGNFLFQRLRPRSAGNEIPAIQKNAQTKCFQGPCQRFHCDVVLPVIAEKQVMHRACITSHAFIGPYVSIGRTALWSFNVSPNRRF